VLSASHNVVLIPSDDESTSGPLTRACAHEKETEEEKESETERQGEQERKRDLALVASSAAWLPLQDHRFCTSSLNLLSPRRSIRIGAGSRARANSNLEIIVPIFARLSIPACRAPSIALWWSSSARGWHRLMDPSSRFRARLIAETEIRAW